MRADTTLRLALDAAGGAPSESELAVLHQRLASQALETDLADVWYGTTDSPVGALLVASTRNGIVRVAFARENFDTVLDTIASRLSPRVIEAPAALDDARRQLDEYFSGARRHFDLDVDYVLSQGFRRLVQQSLPSIGYGTTVSYKQIAERVGNPKAVRAVGTACATNPLPIVIPCHRVLRSDGGFGGYLGGVEAKEILLHLEGAA